jgi:hypothetical protein
LTQLSGILIQFELPEPNDGSRCAETSHKAPQGRWHKEKPASARITSLLPHATSIPD